MRFAHHGILFLISAPSGAGKTTVVQALRKSGKFFYSVSCTTRVPRAGEINGEHYQFLSASDFQGRIDAGDFLEHAKVHQDFYGTLREPVLTNLQNGVDVLIDIDTQGAATIRNCDDAIVRQALADIFIMPSDVEELRRRLSRVLPPRCEKWNYGAITVTLSSAVQSKKISKASATSCLLKRS